MYPRNRSFLFLAGRLVNHCAKSVLIAFKKRLSVIRAIGCMTRDLHLRFSPASSLLLLLQ